LDAPVAKPKASAGDECAVQRDKPEVIDQPISDEEPVDEKDECEDGEEHHHYDTTTTTTTTTTPAPKTTALRTVHSRYDRYGDDGERRRQRRAKEPDTTVSEATETETEPTEPKRRRQLNRHDYYDNDGNSRSRGRRRSGERSQKTDDGETVGYYL